MMLRYAAGDVVAFDVLYTRHATRAWRYLLRHVGDRVVADDLLQDVWFAVARQAPRYQVTARFRTWLFTLAMCRYRAPIQRLPRVRFRLGALPAVLT